jgi:hypothetical protein
LPVETATSPNIHRPLDAVQTLQVDLQDIMTKHEPSNTTLHRKEYFLDWW